MTDLAIDHQITFLATTDLTRTGRFYAEVLGLREARDQGNCLIFEVAAAAYIGFCQRDEMPTPGDAIIVTLVVDDVDAWYAQLRERGVEFDTPPRRNDRYNIYQCFCRDPNGYLIEIQRFLSPEEGKPVIIAAYDPGWKDEYTREAQRIRAHIGARVEAVEHIGSTAVPGLAAKPIIDLMAGVADLDAADACIGALESLGYEYVPEFEGTMPDRRYFRRLTADGTPTHHLHMVVTGDDFWVRHIEFRDYLRAHPDVVREYAALKRDIAARYATDRYGYTSAKGDFIKQVERAAHVYFQQRAPEGA